MKPEIRLDEANIGKLLRSQGFSAAVHGLAERVAASTRKSVPAGVEVVVDDYTTDRAASSVTIKHATGRALQARDGVLTKAAAANGLEVRNS